MSKINAKLIIQNGFPTDEGIRLAKELLSYDDFSNLVIDLTKCDSSLLISAFFNSFLQTIYESDPSRLEEARKISWEQEFDFQRENVANWIKDFEPFTS